MFIRSDLPAIRVGCKPQCVLSYMLAALVLLVFYACSMLAAAAAMPFERYEREFNKHYATYEERQQAIFTYEHNLRFIRSHNAQEERGEATYRMGVNEYTDMRNKEFLWPAYTPNRIRCYPSAKAINRRGTYERRAKITVTTAGTQPGAAN